MTARSPLADRRPAETFQLELNGLTYTVTVGRFDDGSLAEVFISNHKRGNAADVAARDGGILLSLCFQHGVAIDVIKHAVTPGGLVAAVLDAVMDFQS